MNKKEFELYRTLLRNKVNVYTVINTIKNKEDFLEIYSLLPINIKLKIIDKRRAYFYNQIKLKYNLDDNDYANMIIIVSDMLEVFTWPFVRLLYNNRYITEDYFLNYYDKIPKWIITKLKLKTRIFDNCSENIRLILQVLDIPESNQVDYLEALVAVEKVNSLKSLDEYTEDLIYNYRYLFDASKIRDVYMANTINCEINGMYMKVCDNPSKYKSLSLFNLYSIIKFINLYIPFTSKNKEFITNVNDCMNLKNNNLLFIYFNKLLNEMPELKKNINPYSIYDGEKCNELVSVLEKTYFKLKEYDFGNTDLSEVYIQLSYLLTFCYFVKNKKSGFNIETLNVNKYEFNVLNKLYKDAGLSNRLIRVGIYEACSNYEISFNSMIQDIFTYSKKVTNYISRIPMLISNIADIYNEFLIFAQYYEYDINKIMSNISIKPVMTNINSSCITTFPRNNVFFKYNEKTTNYTCDSTSNPEDIIFLMWFNLILNITTRCYCNGYNVKDNYRIEKTDMYKISLGSQIYRIFKLDYNDENDEIIQINSLTDIKESDFVHYKFLNDHVRYDNGIYITDIKY